MGAFSVLKSTNVMPVDGKQSKGLVEIIAVTKYGHSLVQKVLCAHVIKVVSPLNPMYSKAWSDEDDKFNISMVLSDAQKTNKTGF